MNLELDFNLGNLRWHCLEIHLISFWILSSFGLLEIKKAKKVKAQKVLFWSQMARNFVIVMIQK